MPLNKVGGIRRSHCVGNFAPGAIVEFRTSNGAAISAVVCGMEQWDQSAPPPGLTHPQVTFERRLQNYLKVDGFRLPPVPADENDETYLPAVRFPLWLQCPKCQRLRRADLWEFGAVGDPARYCSRCSGKNQRVYVIPVRFVVTCRNGHLQEFPWNSWVQHKPGCKGPDLRLYQADRAGLAGLMLECVNCVQKRSMEGALGKDTLKALKIGCNGERPWLGDGAGEQCTEIPRAVQRGASNLYFPLVNSALSIPPFTDSVQTRLDPFWQDFVKEPPENWPYVIQYGHLDEKLGISADQILGEVRRAIDALNTTGIARIRFEEYEKLRGNAALGEQVDFDIRQEIIPPLLERYFGKIVRVVRLREVKAIRGFTRLQPPSGEMTPDSPPLARISRTRLNWLPAIEVRGEGIFMTLSQSALEKWETGRGSTELNRRARDIDKAYSEVWKGRYGAASIPPRTITPRFLLVHSFAHAMIRQFTVSSGYSSASLRERLYVDGDLNMTGLLIYTATADSDGSLGGLERQGKPDRMKNLVPAAIADAKWCSNDPLCIKDISTFSDSQNRAACHACMMLSETSCEEFNVLLDRATLIGLPDNKDVGFFSSLLNPLAEI
jgi:Domain of unknown function (DUF1998)